MLSTIKFNVDGNLDSLIYESIEILSAVKPSAMLGSIAFHLESSHLFSSANEMTNFNVKCNAGVNWVEKNKLRVKICSISKML